MAEATSSMTSVKSKQDKEERPAVFNYLKLIDNHLCMTMREHFEDVLRKIHFYIKIQPKKISIRQQNVKTLLLLDPRRLEHLKEMGRDQVMTKMFLLENYLEEMRKSPSELVDMVQSNQGEFSLTKQETINESLSGLNKLVNNFNNMSVHEQLHFKHQLISPTAVRHPPSLRLFLYFKRPVMFDRLESTAFDDWANLSWHVSGHQHLTDGFDLRFRQINVPENEEADSGVIILDGNTFMIHFLLPEETYKFSIGRTNVSNTVYDEWRDVFTLTTRAPVEVL
ncbi:fibronectin type III domain-containing protein 11-like [Rana temporaria]|uniref:fibronectin type III domain-containing protein 11-like n=1 Tax=Rana temporaria TaxID=8407 RepID=UPI001AAE05DD|nr:fibronectin type III domain-containing protein 11-like [Rana temporaria]